MQIKYDNIYFLIKKPLIKGCDIDGFIIDAFIGYVNGKISRQVWLSQRRGNNGSI